MKSIPIALVVVVVAVISQTKGMKLSELIADTKQGSFCVPCQMFVSGIVNIAEEAIDWLNQVSSFSFYFLDFHHYFHALIWPIKIVIILIENRVIIYYNVM